jgi:hypothetical protein
MRVHAPLTDEQLAKADIYRTDYRQPGPEWIVTGWTFAGIIEGKAVYEAEKVLAADEAAARFALLVKNYGGFVARLAYHVAILGHTLDQPLPEIIATVVAKSEGGLLTIDQQEAKHNALALYGILKESLDQDTIRAIWAAVKPKEDGE